MSQALPPLPALRAFEAAARHANFARAAAELNVTPGALSHQIRGLEALLGLPLFERQARGVALTPAGRTLQPGLLAGFAQIRDAVAALRARSPGGVLVVSTPPGFTSKWLAPRLHRFALAHPDIELRVASSSAYANFVSDGVDAAVRSVPASQPVDAGLHAEKLVDDELVAVCAPQWLAGARRRTAPDLRRVPLIHDEQLAGHAEVPTWGHWFSAAGLAPPPLDKGLRFSSADHATEAAVQGAGLLLAHAVMAHDELRNGRLVMPAAVVLPVPRSYCFVCPKAQLARPAVRRFRDWLRAEFAAMADIASLGPAPALRRRPPR
jgi:LysR family glycine cleavage system transcriptional activator